MKRILYIATLLFWGLSLYANWKFNPHTGKLDYYEVAGATITSHTGLTDIGTNTHAQIDTTLTNIRNSTETLRTDLTTVQRSTPTFTGTTDGTKFLRDDLSWQTPTAVDTAVRQSTHSHTAGSGITITGTSNQTIAVYGYDTLLKATTNFAGDVTGTFDATVVGNDSHDHGDSTVADNITLTNITQVTNRSHTSLSDIGTRTHAQIDTDLNSVRDSTATLRTDLTTVQQSTYTLTAGANISITGTSDKTIAVVNLTTAQVSGITLYQQTGDYALNRDTKTVGVDVQAYDADLADLADGSLTGAKVGSGVPAANIAAGFLGGSVIASSIAVNAVTIDAIKDIKLDVTYVVLGSTTTAGTKAIPISRVFDSAVTISTVTAWCSGGTSLAFNIEERTSPDSAGTDIWSSDVTATAAWCGGTLGNAAIAAGAQLFLVPTTWTGAVDKIIIKGTATRD